MGKEWEGKLMMLRHLAGTDSRYREIRQEYISLERRFFEMTTRLTEEQQDIAWAFVCTSDELDRRLLEIACGYIDFNRPV